MAGVQENMMEIEYDKSAIELDSPQAKVFGFTSVICVK